MMPCRVGPIKLLCNIFSPRLVITSFLEYDSILKSVTILSVKGIQQCIKEWNLKIIEILFMMIYCKAGGTYYKRVGWNKNKSTGVCLCTNNNWLTIMLFLVLPEFKFFLCMRMHACCSKHTFPLALLPIPTQVKFSARPESGMARIDMHPLLVFRGVYHIQNVCSPGVSARPTAVWWALGALFLDAVRILMQASTTSTLFINKK